jgi:hypothetical protein
MPKNKLNNETREDYHFEEMLPAVMGVMDDEEQAEKHARQNAERLVNREDERIWAWYRDPVSNLTQIEARNRAQERRYPDKYQIKQSSISRKIGRLDDEVLTEPLFQLNMEQVDEDNRDEHQRAGFLARKEHQDLKRYRFVAYLDSMRTSLARFICDMHALQLFSSGERKTPEWAMERFEKLDPNIGREYMAKMDAAIDVHDPQEKVRNDAD